MNKPDSAKSPEGAAMEARLIPDPANYFLGKLTLTGALREEIANLRAELSRERERHQDLRRPILMEALKAVENERLTEHEERLREADCVAMYRVEHGEDAAYSLAIRDAEDAIKKLLDPQPAPVDTTEKGRV